MTKLSGPYIADQEYIFKVVKHMQCAFTVAVDQCLCELNNTDWLLALKVKATCDYLLYAYTNNLPVEKSKLDCLLAYFPLYIPYCDLTLPDTDIDEILDPNPPVIPDEMPQLQNLFQQIQGLEQSITADTPETILKFRGEGGVTISFNTSTKTITWGLENLNVLNGKSAYELAVENGFEGAIESWLESLVGDPGDPGSRGAHSANNVRYTLYLNIAEQEGISFFGNGIGWPTSSAITISDIAPTNVVTGYGQFLNSLHEAGHIIFIRLEELDLPATYAIYKNNPVDHLSTYENGLFTTVWEKVVSAGDPTYTEEYMFSFLYNGLDGDTASDAFYDSFLAEGTLVPNTLGGFSANTPVENLEGLTFSQMFDQLLFPTIPPNYVAPTLQLSSTIAHNTIIEVGQAITFDLTSTWNPGNAGALVAHEITQNNVEISQQFSHSIVNLLLNAEATRFFRSSLQYEEGDVLIDNIGNENSTGQILAGTIESNIISYQWKYPVLFGNIDDPANIVLNDGARLLQNSLNNITMDFGASDQLKWFAVPVTQPNYSEWFISVGNEGAIGGGGLWSEHVLVDSPYEGLFIGTFIQYKLYVTNYATQFDSPIQIS